MRLAILLVVALAAQQPAQPTPAQPFPNHETPPKGWYCTPAKDTQDTQTNAHACSCLGMADGHDPMCGENQAEAEQNQDSSRCKVWCHKDACSCMRLCQDS